MFSLGEEESFQLFSFTTQDLWEKEKYFAILTVLLQKRAKQPINSFQLESSSLFCWKKAMKLLVKGWLMASSDLTLHLFHPEELALLNW